MTATTRRSVQSETRAPGVHPTAGGHVVTDRPERPPTAGILTHLEHDLVRFWVLVVNEVPGDRQELFDLIGVFLDHDFEREEMATAPALGPP